ncbi:MAG: response regulator [Ilumatobacteraceae bacterium]
MARILVVDDDPDVVRLVVRRLQHANHKAHGVHNADDATAFVAERGTPDIVVLDVDMPNVDGLELLGRLREQTGSAELPAIFLSGRMRPDDIAAGRHLGAIYLTKPFVGNALLSAIDGIVEAEQRRTADPNEW